MTTEHGVRRVCILLMMAALAAGLSACSENASEADADESRDVGPSLPQIQGSTPDEAERLARMNRGVGQMGRFDYSAAFDTFQSLVRSHPGWIEASINLAIATLNRQSEGDEANAMALLEDVLVVDPENLRAQYCAGVLKQYRGESAAARVLFESVAAADPGDPYAAYFVGQCFESESPERALEWYERAIEIDPYLRSAYYRASQSLRRLGRQDEAMAYFADFQRLESNPRARLVEFKYTRMGPKAMAQTVDLAVPVPFNPPVGPVFQTWSPLGEGTGRVTWRDSFADDPPSITACDINGDQRVDLFLANVCTDPGGLRNLVLLQDELGSFRAESDHVLSTVPHVRAALWGDYDNDGLTDVYLCRRGPNQLWRQTERSEWQDVTSSTGTANGESLTVNGALFDADHDGDLDIFCVNADAPNELLNNNLDGTFRPIASEQGISGDDRGSSQIIPVDLDRDRDLDLIVVNEAPPHDVYLNDRLWTYRPASTLDDLRNADISHLVTGDRDADGAVELYGQLASTEIVEWRRDGSDRWTRSTVVAEQGRDRMNGQIALIDELGEGIPHLMHEVSGGLRTDGGGELIPGDWPAGARWAPVVVAPDEGPAIVSIAPGAAPQIALPGPGRFPYASLEFSGRVKDADSMRSNASGIGTHIAARIGSRWVSRTNLGGFSGPGQSLQPVAIGLGNGTAIDFVSIDWSDGVFQTELELAAGSLHSIVETQRQLSSCPVLFAWNGSEFGFVSDLLGVGGIGYMVAPHEYAPPRPWERFLFPSDVIALRDGQYQIKLMEPMEEVCYLESASLEVWDLPPGWDLVIDDRMNIAGPDPTGDVVLFREELLPIRAINDRNQNVIDAISRADLVAADVGELDRRFIGRLSEPHVLTVEFERPLNEIGSSPVLVIDGWVEYPYSQTMFASWQAGAAYLAPTLEARGEDGDWVLVYSQFGYPAGMPRRMALPMPELPRGTNALRLSTNQEIYWDRIAVVHAEGCAVARRTLLPVSRAHLSQTGFPKRSTGAQRVPSYDYAQRAPLWDTRHLAGWYTDFGDVTEDVAQSDERVVIFGPGEELHIEFPTATADPPAGWARRVILDVRGWCKDMDLFTKDGDTVEPLPVGRDSSGFDDISSARSRYQSGR